MKKILLLALLSAFGLSAQTASDYVTELPDASGIAFDSTGNLYIADYYSKKITKVTPSLVQSNFATVNINPYQITFDANSNLWVTEFKNSNYEITKITAGGLTTNYITTGNPYGIAADAAGNVFYSSQSSNEVKKISITGTISTFFSDPDILKRPSGIIFDKAGNLIVTDYSDNPLKKISPAGVITKIPSSLPTTPSDKLLAFASNGDLYISLDQKIFRLPVDNANGTLTLFYDFGANCTIYGMTIYNKNLYAAIYDGNSANNKKGKVVKISDPILEVENTKKTDTESITIYPNPASDYLHVESKNEMIKTIELYDITGRLVKNYTPSEIKDNTIALSALISGNYILKINNTSKKITIN